MPREIKMPKLSDTMEEGTLNVWRKSEGELVERGDILVEIETDKADMEFEAYMSGVLARILVPAGETVSIGTPIAVIRLDGDSDEDMASFAAAASVVVTPAPTPATPAETPPPPVAAAPRAPREVVRVAEALVVPGPAPSPFRADDPRKDAERLPFFVPDPDRVRATPRARILAEERGIDLSEIAGSGPGGAVRVADLDRYVEALDELVPPVEGDVAATPVATRMAEELRVDLSRVKGTGPGGRVTKRDVRSHVERETREGPVREARLYGDMIKLSQKRKFLINNMTESKRSAPHFYISVEVDAEPSHALRERFKAEDRRLTYTHMILKAAALALERFPEANSRFREDRIQRFSQINIAIAVDVQDELVAPVIKNCQGRDIATLAADCDALIARAREKKLAPGDYSDGTFTISNLGMMGVDHFYAIITPPQSMVLSVGSLRILPRVDPDSGAIVAGRQMDFGLACDHRVLDGAKAARVLQEIKRVLENPDELLLGDSRDGN